MVLSAGLVSCGGSDAQSTVGRVGEFEVKYEELYFLCTNYAEELGEKYGEYSSLNETDKADFDAELNKLVYENQQETSSEE